MKRRDFLKSVPQFSLIGAMSAKHIIDNLDKPNPDDVPSIIEEVPIEGDNFIEGQYIEGQYYFSASGPAHIIGPIFGKQSSRR